MASANVQNDPVKQLLNSFQARATNLLERMVAEVEQQFVAQQEAPVQPPPRPALTQPAAIEPRLQLPPIQLPFAQPPRRGRPKVVRTPPPERSPENQADDLRVRIRMALTKESLDTKTLAKTVGVKQELLQPVLDQLRQEGQVFNMGFEDWPRWTWRIGENSDTATLRNVILRLISERPMALRDLVAATGVKNSRVSGAVIEIQRSHNVIDLAPPDSASRLYFLVSEGAKDARLPSRTALRHKNKAAAKPTKK